jgi:membrane protein YqaA with SNARE-associated domain
MENTKKGILSSTYFKMIEWSRHRYATKYLAAVSFMESSFFPIPPDVMLLPMVLGKPVKAYYYAFIATVFSILGGILGYAIGYFAFEAIGIVIIDYFGIQDAFLTVKEWFKSYGFYAVLLAGVTPIPYKLFTITAGLVAMNFPAFFIASIFGRGMRFFLVAIIMKKFGHKFETVVVKYLDRAGWIILAICLLLLLIYKFI